MNTLIYKNSKKYFYWFLKNTSFASSIFSSTFLFFVYVVFNFNFLPIVSNEYVLDGGTYFLPRYFIWLLFAFFLFSLGVFLFRKFRWWIGFICLLPLTIFAFNILIQSDSSLLYSQNILGTLSWIVDPFYYYEFFESLYYIFIPLFAYLLLIFCIQIIFDITIGRYKNFALIFVMVTLIGSSFLITYQVKQAEKFDFVSNNPIKSTGRFISISVGEDVKEVNTLFEKYNNLFIHMNTLEREKSGKDFEYQFGKEVENLKKETCDSKGFFQKPCERLYESAIISKKAELKKLIEFWGSR